jgi:hypothetical protein
VVRVEALQRHHTVFAVCFKTIHSDCAVPTAAVQCPAAQLVTTITKTNNEENLLSTKFSHLHTITRSLYIQTGSLILKSNTTFGTVILSLCSTKLLHTS